MAYVDDDEDLETDLEASGSNRIRNDTSIAYQLDDTSSENENWLQIKLAGGVEQWW